MSRPFLSVVHTLTPRGWVGGWVRQRPRKRSLCHSHRPQISGPFDKFSFFFWRKIFLMWMGGWVGGWVGRPR